MILDMKVIGLVWVVAMVGVACAGTLYECIRGSFDGGCKSRLYDCTNTPECSYQLHENTKHIFLDAESEVFPPLYFSHPLARSLYDCLRKECALPPIDESYPKTLPFDYCLLEVYDQCGGDIQEIFTNPKLLTPEADCYRKLCNFPQISTA